MPSDLSVSSAAVETASRKITEAEQAILQQLGKPDISVDVIVPDDMVPADFKVTLSAVCKTLVRAKVQEETLLPVLGKLMLLAKHHPELWQKNPDQPFKEFVAYLETEFGVGQATCYDAARLVARWGGYIDLDDWKRTGRVKLELISKAVAKGDEGKKTAKTLLEMAPNKTIKELTEYIEEKGYIERGESQGAVIRIPCSQTVNRMWLRFISDELVQAYCESSKPDLILKHCIEECQNEWVVKAKEKMEAERKS